MTNCDKIRNAVHPYAGQGLTSGKVVSLVISMYPGTNPTSILPSDHSGPNPRSGRSYCGCSGTSNQIFSRSGSTYLVRNSDPHSNTQTVAPSNKPSAAAWKSSRATRLLRDTDRVALVESLRRLKPSIRPSSDRAWQRDIAVRAIDCVLSLSRKYDSFLVPRLNQFEHKHPEVRSITDLQSLINTYPSPARFVAQCLNYDHEARAITLAKVVDGLAKIVGDDNYDQQLVNLELWATNAKPEDHFKLGIAGFALGGFQYLRMLFGANTTKPDVHIQRYVAGCVGHRVSDVQALLLLETAAKEADVCLRDLDTTIWEQSARGKDIA